MPEFTVCSKSGVKKTVKQFGATHLLSTLDVGDRIFRPVRIDAANHLRLNFDDEEDVTKFYAPQLWHAESIINWGAQLPPDARVVVHCAAGVCRSTAVGLALWVQAKGWHRKEEGRAWLLDTRPTACPNLLLAEFFDRLLNLNGEFVELCDQIGRTGIARWWKINAPD